MDCLGFMSRLIGKKVAASDGPLRIACISVTLSGHMNPVMHIAEAMAARNHTVAVVTFEEVDEEGRAKYAENVGMFNGVFMGLPCEKSERQFLDEAEKQGVVPFNSMREHMSQSLMDAMREWGPDVIVTDGMTLAPMDVSEALGVPLVVNVPGPVWQVQQGLQSGFSDAGPYHVDAATFRDHIAPRFRKCYARALIAVNSFFGLEPPCAVMPYVAVTGTLATDAVPPEISPMHYGSLLTFLDSATQVVFVTTGSMVELPEWLVVVLFHGLKSVGCHVVWSLPEDVQRFVPERSERFHIEKWLPQSALLYHPKVTAVITHCGWSAVHECVAGAKPVLPLPFQADQPFNAELLLKNGMGARLAPTPEANVDHSGGSAYKEGSLTAEQVEAAVREVLGNRSYQQRAEKLRAVSKEAGGAAGLAVRIENAARNGVAHLHGEA